MRLEKQGKVLRVVTHGIASGGVQTLVSHFVL